MGITIDVEAVLVQCEGAQLGHTMGPMAHLPVQLLSVQLRIHIVRMVCADSINSSGCSIFFRPEQGQSAAKIEGPNTAVLEQWFEQAIQDSLHVGEYLRSRVPHSLCVA